MSARFLQHQPSTGRFRWNSCGRSGLVITCLCIVIFSSIFRTYLFTAAWKEMRENKSDFFEKAFQCLRCAPGCARCKGPEPCLATYNWPFRYFFYTAFSFVARYLISIMFYHFSRITLLAVSIFCAFGTIVLVAYMYQHRKLKVFKVASPIFLSITLLGCALMYLEVSEETFLAFSFNKNSVEYYI